MNTKKPTPQQLDMVRLSIKQVLGKELPEQVRSSLEAAVSSISTLMPDEDPAAHLPIYVTAINGDRDVVGCSCGHVPSSRAARFSMTMGSFNTHLTKLGIARSQINQTPRYADGPRKGMTMLEAIRAGIPVE